MRLSSFDIFDTTLTRTVALPRDLFLLLAERLIAQNIINNLSPVAFANARVKAETQARSRRLDGEVTLAEIYDELAATLDWLANVRQKVEAAELETEADCLRAVPAMKARVVAARQAGNQIAFLSDMYLPSAFLEKVLRREGLFQDGDWLHVSGEARASKAAGTLYTKLRQTLPAGVVWQHTGDNRNADVIMARAQQVAAEEFPDAHLTRYENLARNNNDIVPLWRSQLAGAMRITRLANPEKDSRRQAIWESGSSVVGPLLLGFVHWCLAEAESRGIRRLYFVARDGQIMHQLAEQIVRTRNLKIECRYLYGSRQAWHPASIGRFDPEEYDWVLPHTKWLTLDQVLRRIDLRPEDFSDVLTRAGFGPATWCEPLRGDPQQLSGLLRRPELVTAIETNAKQLRAAVLQYLEQEGFLEDVPSAIVDIGWQGNLQKSLARLLALSNQPARAKLTGFYFGLVKTLRFDADQVVEGYLNQDSEIAQEFKRQNLCMFELFTAADHGSVTGYEERAGRIVPKLAGERNDRALDWGLEVLQASVRQFTKTWLESAPPADWSAADYRRVTFGLYRQFYEQPSLAEAMVWGEFPFSEEQHEQNFHQMTPALTGWETLRAIADIRHRPAGWWLEGAQAVHPNLPLWAYLKARRLKALMTP